MLMLCSCLLPKRSNSSYTSGLGSQGIERFFVTAIPPQQRHGEFANVGNKHKEFAIFESCRPGVHHNFLRLMITKASFLLHVMTTNCMMNYHSCKCKIVKKKNFCEFLVFSLPAALILGLLQGFTRIVLYLKRIPD